MIHHLSFPAGNSVNDGIDPELCTVSYASFDQAIEIIKKCGKGALLAKSDIESAFRLLPIHPECWKLLGFHFEGLFYFDCCLPMGCSLSCYYFEAFATFVQWVVQYETNCKFILHYLDDFLFVGPPQSDHCFNLLRRFIWMASKFGIPLSKEKTVYPTTVMQFLGIEIDTIKQEFRLPQDKLIQLKSLINSALAAKKLKLKHIQSLVGHLNFTTKIIPIGRVFNRRLIALTEGIANPNWHIRIPQEVKEDLIIWQQFLHDFNGKAYWQDDFLGSSVLHLFTDAASSAGFGAIFNSHWCSDSWPISWHEQNLTKNLVLLEFFPILVVLEIWGAHLANKRIIWHTDNLGVVYVLNNLTSNSPPVLRLLRQVVFRALKYNIWIRAKHIPGFKNNIADALSRFQFELFWKIADNPDPYGASCPDYLWGLVLPEHVRF
ncbi:uncharacterized protein LOC121396972 [Xenopus laevis]|uniref:ribonuclease H n=1 Tax=Xenopus laevis TaxID=8355 RepID=A0A8J1LGT2_XENLA|nr:uncharacterized protein LOC121396972 [Xenopus laevis]